MTDDDLRHAVAAELCWDPRVDSAAIEVSAASGLVTLRGTVASLRQMWGRAGRRGRGLAVYVAGEDALDQFFCRHPESVANAIASPLGDQANPSGYLEAGSRQRYPDRSTTRMPRPWEYARRRLSGDHASSGEPQ